MSEEFSVSIDTVTAPSATLVARAGGFDAAFSLASAGLMLSAAAAAKLATIAAQHASDGISGARARLDALANDEGMALVRSALGSDGLATLACARRALAAAAPAASVAEPLAIAEHTLDAAFARLRSVEPVAVLSAVRSALEHCGFKLEAARPARGARARVVGRKAGRTVVLELDRRNSRLSGDVGGFSGIACRAEVSAILAALAERGLSVGSRLTRLHGDPRGGVMLRSAGRAGESPVVSQHAVKVGAR